MAVLCICLTKEITKYSVRSLDERCLFHFDVLRIREKKTHPCMTDENPNIDRIEN